MGKVIFLLGFFMFWGVKTQAQVTIGSGNAPHSDALLELTEGLGSNNELSERGLLLPRVALVSANQAAPLNAHVRGMVVYNTVIAGTGAGQQYVSPGFYYNDGTQWVRMPLGGATNWFYMPSVSFDTTVDGQTTKNLYNEYIRQFTGTNGRLVGSDGAPSVIPYLPAATDLFYYITDYDPAVFSNISIDENGVMTYTISSGAASDCSYINIVFVLK
ncbi:MAG: hypothetical protein E6772_02955 [Dysgonomonas sp.]|nr:hypothetical protein [Dysgonomonas sp.]